MVMIHIKDILKDFNKYAEARKNYTLRTKLVFIFCSVTIAMILFFSYRVVNNAMSKILVVNEGGEFVHFKAMQTDKLYESLLKSHCYYTSYYLNSFDRLTIEENQARGLFLVNKGDANTIFAKYQADRAYGDALELGVVYNCEYEKITEVRVQGNEYNVQFTSVLSIISNTGTKRFRIISEGTAIRTTPQYPENVTGFFFKTYRQTYMPYEKE
jgi:hypothetical protein